MSMSARREHHEIAFNGSWVIDAAPDAATVYVRGADRLAVTYDGRGRAITVGRNGHTIAGPGLREKVSDILYTKASANRRDEVPAGHEQPPRLLITGSRTWDDRKVIRDSLRTWWESTGKDPEAVLVSGACPKGADRICEEIWEHNGLTVERHPAVWRPGGVYNHRAGYDRNEAMVDTAPDHCIAFIRAGSGGASHCARYARSKGIEVTLVEAD